MGSLKRLVKKIIYRLMRSLPIKKNQVLLFSYYGEQYSGSPKYIGKYLDEHTDMKVVWAFVDPKKHQDVSGEIVRYGQVKYYYYLATSGTIVTNYRMTSEFRKRNKQKYIQTWHSSLRLKMIENDAVETLPKNYIEMAKEDSKQLDVLLAGSQKSREIFEGCFWYDGVIADTGTPQCDILFDVRDEYKEKVFKFYNIPQGSNIALYAPTFRKNHNTEVYNLETTKLVSVLEKRFGGEWYLLMRLHPHLINKTGCFQYSEKVIQATSYDDVQELLCATDVLISDYSAIMFDYLVTKRPGFLYVPDIEDYVANDRKLYFDIDKLPFCNCRNLNDLYERIESFSEKDYAKRIEQFLNEIGSYDDGKACERVYELIKEKK